MPSDDPSAPLGVPFAASLMRALERIRAQEAVPPAEQERRAADLLADHFAASDANVATGYGAGCIGLVAEHTHYFPGFALALSLPDGAAVAVRPRMGEGDALVVQDGDARTSVPPEAVDAQPEEQVVRCALQVVRERLFDLPPALDVAIADAFPLRHADGGYAALAVGTLRATAKQTGGNLDDSTLVEAACEAVERALGRPFSKAHPLAALGKRFHVLVLIDTLTEERIELDLPPRERLCWGLVDVRQPYGGDPSFQQNRRIQANHALALLQQGRFAALDTLRDLEHRDLEAALQRLPQPLVPVVRHLVSENRRVQRLVTAQRQRNWQFFGAILVMSHLSLRDAWQATNRAVDFAFDAADAQEGLYGARMVGSEAGRGLIVIGPPASVVTFLDHVAPPLDAQFGAVVHTRLL